MSSPLIHIPIDTGEIKIGQEADMNNPTRTPFSLKLNSAGTYGPYVTLSIGSNTVSLDGTYFHCSSLSASSVYTNNLSVNTIEGLSFNHMYLHHITVSSSSAGFQTGSVGYAVSMTLLSTSSSSITSISSLIKTLSSVGTAPASGTAVQTTTNGRIYFIYKAAYVRYDYNNTLGLYYGTYATKGSTTWTSSFSYLAIQSGTVTDNVKRII